MKTIYSLLAKTDSSAAYRQQWPALFCRQPLGQRSIRVIEREGLDFDEMVASDAIFFVDVSEGLAHHLKYLKKMGKRIAWVVDDDLWGWPGGGPDRSLLDDLRWDLADLIVVNNPCLANLVRNPAKTVTCPNLIPATFWPKLRPKRDGARTLLWGGSCLLQGDLEHGREVVEELARQFYPNLLVHTLVEPVKDWEMSTTIHQHPLVMFEPYCQWMSRFQPDIAIIPRLDQTFNRCKSSLKALEMAMIGATTVATDLPNYRDVKASGVPVYLIPGDAGLDEWVVTIKSLLGRGTNKYDTHAERARKAVLDHHSNNNVSAVNTWVNAFTRMVTP